MSEKRRHQVKKDQIRGETKVGGRKKKYGGKEPTPYPSRETGGRLLLRTGIPRRKNAGKGKNLKIWGLTKSQRHNFLHHCDIKNLMK